jgi:hypothetical protein
MHCSQATHLSFGSYATRFALPQQTHGGACFVQSCQQRVPFPSLLALPPGCGCTTTTLATMTPQTRAHLRRGVSSLAAAAPETPPDTPPESFPLLDLPAPALRLVLLSLWADAGDCAAFACCSTATAALCDDRHLWCVRVVSDEVPPPRRRRHQRHHLSTVVATVVPPPLLAAAQACIARPPLRAERAAGAPAVARCVEVGRVAPMREHCLGPYFQGCFPFGFGPSHPKPFY